MGTDSIPDVSWAEILGAVFAKKFEKAKPQGSGDPSESANVSTAAAEIEAQRQITPITADELTLLQGLCEHASKIEDEIEKILGDRPNILKGLRSEIQKMMLDHGLREVHMPDRPPVILQARRSPNPSKTNLTTVLGPAEANRVWKALPAKTGYTLNIPGQTPPEGPPE
jgi:hypothetical protein